MRFLSILKSKFLTENGFFPNWREETSGFRLSGWVGRRNLIIAESEVRGIFSKFFSPERKTHFKVFYESDYKRTYFGDGLLEDGRGLFLKHYRVGEASLKIQMRNLLRRTIARKGLNLYFPLRDRGVEAVCPLFYLRRRGRLIPPEALFASRAAGGSDTVGTIWGREMEFLERISLAMSLGAFAGKLHREGILFGELYRNLIVWKKGEGWEIVLCDLDEMRSISGFGERDRKKYLAALRNLLLDQDESLSVVFDQSYKETLFRA